MLSVLKDHVGKLINAQFLLKEAKKDLPTVVIFSRLKDHSGKPVSAQFSLKEPKKLVPAVVIFDVLKHR